MYKTFNLNLKLWKALAVVSSLCLFLNIFLKRTEHETKIFNVTPKLISASVIFRHGDRNILKLLPIEKKKQHGYKFGEITQLGVEQEYDLGAYLRRRYASLLGDGRYSNNNVQIRSSDQDRTLRSAAVCLAGLFPSKYDQIWNRDISWQTIPIHTVPRHEDYILYPGKKCPKEDRAFNEYLQSPEFIAITDKYKNLLSQLEMQSGKTLKSFHDVKDLYDTLWIKEHQNFTLPTWAMEALNNSDLKWIVDHTYQMRTNTTLLARLHSGFLVREILEHFERKINESSTISLILYSASGNTIAKVLNSLRLFDPHAPRYAGEYAFCTPNLNVFSCSENEANESDHQISNSFENTKIALVANLVFIPSSILNQDNIVTVNCWLFNFHHIFSAASLHFELYSLNYEHYMQIIYKDTDDENPLPLKIPSYGEYCSIEQFKSVYSEVIPTGTFDEECQ